MITRAMCWEQIFPFKFDCSIQWYGKPPTFVFLQADIGQYFISHKCLFNIKKINFWDTSSGKINSLMLLSPI